MLESSELQRQKDKDAFRRLFTEMLINVYNDIMNEEEYQYALYQWLKNEDAYYKRKIHNHFGSIDWLINYALDSMCFRVLDLTGRITTDDIEKSIANKMRSKSKYFKFFTDYKREYGGA